MRKKLHFTKAEWKDNQLELHTDQPETLADVKASGQVIVDSDATAFVYLAEENDEFIYLYIHESTWAEIQTALQKESKLFAAGADTSIELIGWKEELSDLIENIQGNSNYGDQMVESVERVFINQ
ncbi:hypothetical protein JOC78_000451 [Bacillus ectoiniformans]|uniref:UPF0738 family protein n=1 Tax=Bacillus ectoiniformans TaxID=1494429 RepID=UPI001956C307|nr:hypothetical protein [Bacillus ectoiniformans]MBM7647530.1 hypothetical protein [Bacillus ectoiniformans]